MLSPENRAVLLEALRPPEGFTLDHAVVTTFTLDLTALLTAPLAFSLYDSLLSREPRQAGASGVDTLDPYALLKAVRGHADQITVFCQVARIAAPGRFQRLLGYLEPCVVQVQAPAAGKIFHPKVWLLRFRSAGHEQVRYRLLCTSRNLTFDRSWDTLLTLDGELLERTRAISRNHPLGDFVASLPALAVASVDVQRRRVVGEMAEEVRRVQFEPPPNVDDVSFIPLGVAGYNKWPFPERSGRMLVVSPFVEAAALERLVRAARGDVLVSRIEDLQEVSQGVLGQFQELHVLSSTAELEDEDRDTPAAAGVSSRSDGVASGLHAKLYVADDGGSARVWTGSANATTAAFGGNVEFMVQLSGKRKNLGVDALLDGPEGRGGLRALLAAFTPPPVPVLPTPAERALQAHLDAARGALAAGKWVVTVGAEEAGRFPIVLAQRGPALSLPDGVTVTVRPIALQHGWGQTLVLPAKGPVADYGLCSFEAITSFLAFETSVGDEGVTIAEEFVLNATLEGAPKNRGARILQSLLDEPEKFLRFLKILLATDPAESLDLLADVALEGEGSGQGERNGEEAVLELMLRALHRDPVQIDAIENIVADLRSTEGAVRSMPPHFEKIWGPIAATRAALRSGGRT